MGFVADDKETWTTEHLPIGIRGMQEWPPVAQEKFAWETRLKALPIFARIWKVPPDSMISSMDRVCFVPSTRLKLNKKTELGWMHVDQSRRGRRGNLECFQGFITLNEIGASEVALEVMKGAHKCHRKFFEERHPLNTETELKTKNSDWFKFAAEDIAWYEKQPNVERTRVHAKAGSLVLWDSRLPHHAMPPRDNNERSDVDRYVIYTCFTPRAWANEATLKHRVKAFEGGRATPHWPHDKRMFNFKPRTYGNELPLADFDVAKQLKKLKDESSDYELIKTLAGYPPSSSSTSKRC